eukprot:Anaeramoba_ignava/a479144_40.p1 GENE.a479144_40~~a479144_40.p1  ORF type:complete len:607 (+),score=163.26 a479144_40:46-1866(+)
MNSKLIFNSRIFRLKSFVEETGKKYYRCMTPNCGATLIRFNNQYRLNRPHSEECEKQIQGNESLSKRFWEFINQMASELGKTSMEIYQLAVERINSEIGEDDHFEIPPAHHVLQTISTIRKARFPFELIRILSESPYSQTKNEKKFWRFSSEVLIQDKKEMAVCWFSDSVASSLFQANQIFIDGTFLSAAKPFTQLITIMCFDHSSRIYVPAVYAISTSSKQDMYTFIFENIFRYFLNSKWKFKYVTCDFEVSLQNAIKKVLPEAQLIGCFFHWKNAIRKKVNKLCSELDENQKKELVESLEELTYIPLNMIEEKLKKIKVHFKGCEEFFKYFQKIWMRKYSPQIWNISSFPDLSQRTNGPLEGYHKRLNRRIGHEKPKLIQMVELLKSEEELIRKKIQFQRENWTSREIPTDNEETTKWWEKVQKYRKEDEEKKDELRLSSQVRKKQGRKNSQDKKKRQSSQILEEQEENQIIQEEIENYVSEYEEEIDPNQNNENIPFIENPILHNSEHFMDEEDNDLTKIIQMDEGGPEIKKPKPKRKLYRHSSFSDWSSEEDFDLSEERVSEHENGFEKKRHKNSEKKYCCSQCGKPGHNKVTCPKNGDKWF